MSNQVFLYISDGLFLLIGLSVVFSGALRPKAHTVIYYSISAAMVVLTLARPLGLSVDDSNYLALLGSIDGMGVAEIYAYYERDLVYYVAVKYVRELVGERAIMVLAAAVLLIKLVIIKRLTRNATFALFAYFCLGFFLHDIIQFRASLAIMFLFVAIWCFDRAKRLGSIIAVILGGLSHYSGFAGVGLVLRRFGAPAYLYFFPLLVCLLSLSGIFALSSDALFSLVPGVASITRYLEPDSIAKTADYFVPHFALYSAVIVTFGRVERNPVSGAGMLALTLSSLSLGLFSNAIALAVRFNELFAVFYCLNVGYYRSRGIDWVKIVLLVTVGLFYIRARYINLLIG